MFAFLGGLSAATAMVIVACVALSIMISNDLVMPLMLRSQRCADGRDRGDMGRLILVIRRIAIVVAAAARPTPITAPPANAALASIGLFSFAAIAQIAPAFFGGLFWRRRQRARRHGGHVAGFWSGPTRCCCHRSLSTRALARCVQRAARPPAR